MTPPARRSGASLLTKPSPKSVKVHLWQCFQSRQPGFSRFAQICREAHRRSKPELIMHGVASMMPIRAASGGTCVLLRQLAELSAALIVAGKEIVKLNSGQRDTPLLQMMRGRVREAKQLAARFAFGRKKSVPHLLLKVRKILRLPGELCSIAAYICGSAARGITS